MTQHRVKVLYIAGWGRSGSTILARILGQVEGLVHTGELRTIWIDGFKPKSVCGCGTLVRNCEVWQDIFKRSFDGIENIDPQAMAQLRLSTEPRSQEILTSHLFKHQKQQLHNKLQAYIQILDRLYPAIQEATGTQIIVDDSLHPGYAYTLSLVPSIDLHLIHLVRDPRGCAYSWEKRHKKGLGYYNLKESSLGWNLRNLGIEMLKFRASIQHLTVRYEDFISQPQLTLLKILTLVNCETKMLPFASQFEVNLNSTHSIFGNDNRTATGLIRLQVDDSWKTMMTAGEKLKVNLLTWPLLLKYRYSIRV